jgi:hypothetical protein
MVRKEQCEGSDNMKGMTRQKEQRKKNSNARGTTTREKQQIEEQ